MKVYSITIRNNQYEQWNKVVGEKFELIRIDHNNIKYELALAEHDSILLVDLVSCKELFVETMIDRKILLKNLHVIGLSNIPNIHECLGLLGYGIKAYGHNLMDPSLFNEMLDKVSDGHMWFPELILEDVIKVALHSSDQPQKLDSLEMLTPREQEVAFNVAQGKTNKEIAKTLSLSPDTVKLHLNHIYRKLDIDNRVALALKLKV
ncbi:MAG: response regulator transcription factor [Campylobacterota bacterium]|nr:response regulator transcription factor [Campylobacterota bacterium]